MTAHLNDATAFQRTGRLQDVHGPIGLLVTRFDRVLSPSEDHRAK